MIGACRADTYVRVDLSRIEERLSGFQLEGLRHDIYFDPTERKAKSLLGLLGDPPAICVPNYRSLSKDNHLHWVPSNPK